MVRFEDAQEADSFRQWLIDVMLVASQSSAEAQVVKTVIEQARAYSLSLAVNPNTQCRHVIIPSNRISCNRHNHTGVPGIYAHSRPDTLRN
jgi:hypothetical protein